MAAIVTREYKNFSLDPNSKAQYHASIGTSISIIVNSVLGNPGKMVPGKNGPWKIDPRKIGPRETQKRKIVGWALSIVVCMRNVGMWPIYENPKLDNKPKTRKQTQNMETKNRGVSVEHRVVCVCRMFGCDQSMKTQNSTTNLPGLL